MFLRRHSEDSKFWQNIIIAAAASSECGRGGFDIERPHQPARYQIMLETLAGNNATQASALSQSAMERLPDRLDSVQSSLPLRQAGSRIVLPSGPALLGLANAELQDNKFGARLCKAKVRGAGNPVPGVARAADLDDQPVRRRDQAEVADDATAIVAAGGFDNARGLGPLDHVYYRGPAPSSPVSRHRLGSATSIAPSIPEKPRQSTVRSVGI
jgi:hypothetical protein